MQLSMVVVWCSLVGQVPAEVPLPHTVEPPPALLPPVAQREPVAERAVPETDPAVLAKDVGLRPQADAAPAETPPAVAPIARRLITPPEMVAQALVSPPGSALTGRPLTLLAALSSTMDRRHQLEVTRAYWRLVEAVAVYYFSLEHDRQLQDFAAEARQEPLLRTARASSAALVREAEVAAVSAQHELAALVLLPPDAPLPLPADPPHVGEYLTHFDRLFSMQTPPGRTRLIDRTLPIRSRAIQRRASAALAAEDAVGAALDAHRSGGGDLPTVLARMEEHLRQREALIRSVCLYNHEIADYALSVARPGSSGQALVGMLIHPPPQPLRPLGGGGQGGLEPAGYNERVPTPARRPGQRVPTPARRPGQNEPTPAAPRVLSETLDKEFPTPATQWSPSPPPGKHQPTPAIPPEEAEPSESAPPGQPPVPVEPRPTEPTSSTVNKPITDVAGRFRGPALYPTLIDALPEARASQLTLALHRDRALPEGSGGAVSLADCLGRYSGGDRLGLINAYWSLRQRAAEHQVLVEQAELLDGLVPAPRDEEHVPGLRLRAARLDGEAALFEAQAAVLEARFELATRLGRESDPLWPMPSTAPRWDRYPVELDRQPRRLAESWPLRRLAAMIPGLAESVQQRANAVVEADAARASAAAVPQADAGSIEPLLAGIHRQTEQTFAFLGTLTDYNRAIAQYTLTVLPLETPGDKLAEVLVAVP